MSYITIQNLTKKFGKYTAVDALDLKVESGEIFGFLGPNGAGKTTTIKMIAGLLKPDEGEVAIGGHMLSKEPLICKKITGYIPDRPWLFEKLSGMEYLQFIASLYAVPETEFLPQASKHLEYFDLIDWKNNLIESYSHGMRQKLIMTSVFMLQQPFLIIDEPMVGLDPKSAKIVKELFKQRAREGTTIFLSTHSLEIAEELCNRIGIIKEGKLRITGDMESLRREAGKDRSGQLEDIFLELTGAWELQQVIAVLQKK